MSAKAIIVFCAQALLMQTAFGQCTSPAVVDASGYGPLGRSVPGFASGLAGSALAYNGLPGRAGRGPACDGLYAPAMEFTATSGGSLPVTSSSAIAPTGISIVSENAYEGALSVAGELPFVGTTGMEGALPSAGAGAVNHACGDGTIAMISEAAIAPGAATAPGAANAPVAGFTPSASFATAARFGPVGGFGLGAGLSPLGFGPSNGLGSAGCGRGIY